MMPKYSFGKEASDANVVIAELSIMAVLLGRAIWGVLRCPGVVGRLRVSYWLLASCLWCWL